MEHTMQQCEGKVQKNEMKQENSLEFVYCPGTMGKIDILLPKNNNKNIFGRKYILCE